MMKNTLTTFVIVLMELISFRGNAQCNFFLPDKNNFNFLGSAYSEGNGCFHLTNHYSQSGAAWYRDSADLNNDFDLSFNTSQCGSADGMMFILQSCSNGLNALGGSGGDMGYYENPASFTHSLGVEFDIYNNGAFGNDSNSNHIAIVSDNVNTILAGPVAPSTYLGDCSTRTLRFTWNAASHLFSVYMNGVLQTSYTADLINDVFGGNPNIYFGFTASTGGEYANQTFCTNYMHYQPSHPHEAHITYNSLCPGGTLSALASGVSYLWSTGDTSNTTTADTAGTYTVTVTDSGGCSRSGQYTVNPSPGDPSIFGDYAWNVYVWNAGDGTDTAGAWMNNYSGYFVETNLSFNTQDRWYILDRPSDASEYQGCPVDYEHHSWSAKRQGFSCGMYQVNIPGHDDAAQLFVNGSLVWEHIGCCDAHTNVWTGLLDNTSTVEFRCSEGGGGSWGSIELIAVTDLISVNGPVSICPGYSLELTTVGNMNSYWWNTGDTTQSITINAAGTYSISFSNGSCTVNDSVSIAVQPLTIPIIEIFHPYYICQAAPVLTISNYNEDNTYQWNNGMTGITIYPDTTGDFTVTATDILGCISDTSSILTLNPSPPPGDPSVYGDHVWNVYGYATGNASADSTSWLPSGYAGYYVNTKFNFDTRDSWGAWLSPSDAAGYSGCPVPADYHSWSAKRKGFPTGIYQLDVPGHDDEEQLFIDGVNVWEHDGFSDLQVAVWTGWLGENSEVEVRGTEGAGDSYGTLTLTGTFYYADVDTDGYGDLNAPLSFGAVSTDGYVVDNSDCNDADASINPAASEILFDGIDNNCNGETDEGCYSEKSILTGQSTSVGYRAPNPRYKSGRCVYLLRASEIAVSGLTTNDVIRLIGWNNSSLPSIAATGTLKIYLQNATDEAYNKSPVWTTAIDSMSVVYNDTATLPAVTGFWNIDISDSAFKYTGNGLYVATEWVNCGPISGTVSQQMNLDVSCRLMSSTVDCNPSNSMISTAQRPVTMFSTQSWWFLDSDSDGYAADSLLTCDVPAAGWVSVVTGKGDCNDADGTVWQNASLYSDGDGDGYDNGTANVCYGASIPLGYTATTNGSDCDDATAFVHPGAAETCNSVDDNCNGQFDEGVKATFYTDADGDGYGNPGSPIEACTPPSGYVADSTDCNDTKVKIYPGANETCNSLDDDCDGQIDEGVLTATITPSGNVSYCAGNSITLTSSGGSGISFQWIKNGVNISGATAKTFTPTTSGNYQVAQTKNSCSATSVATVVSKIAKPAATITPQGNLNICEAGSVVLQANTGTGFTYQWKKGKSDIAGATNSSYTATAKSNYKVVVTSDGCSNKSAPVTVTKVCKSGGENNTEEPVASQLIIYPNPTTGIFVVDLNLSNDETEQVTIQIYNSIGQLVQQEETSAILGKLNHEIHLAPTASGGMYLIRIIAADELLTRQFILQK